ncbi:flavodoxin domain-containing protein [Bauldia sp.]|uniref:flavodoxin domain-containing protein n=1 Tax=Bauldia sp. TaxID=2575872 RepID=UPI003BA95B78
MKILIGYASKYGSTQEIAERIAARLVDKGLEIEIRRLDREVDVTAYDAAVIGSAVYSGSWMENAVEFARKNRGKLATLPVWLYTVGRLSAQRGVMGKIEWPSAKEAEELSAVIHPRDSVFFAGAIFEDKLPFVVRTIFAGLGGQYGDFRDWDEIDVWADGIAEALTKSDDTPTRAAG